MDQSYCLFCMSPLVDGICPNHCPPVVSNRPHMLQPGTMLNYRYLIGRSLGQGGFGITYLCRDILMDVPVAIKEFYPSGAATRDISRTSEIQVSGDTTQEMMNREIEKFFNEARVLARFLDEPGIVHVTDFFPANNTAYIVTEYINGETLRDYQVRAGRISLENVLTLFAPVFQALSRIHEMGLIHRDISPDNIMITPTGSARLLDFGTVRTVSLAGEHSMSVILKPGYAPGEQYSRRGVQGPWTDVYGLAATIYRCITGTTPDDAFQRMYRDELKRPSQLGVPIDRRQEDALMKGLACRSEERYQSVQEFVSALSEREHDMGQISAPLKQDSLPLTEETEQGEENERDSSPSPEEQHEEKATEYVPMPFEENEIRNQEKHDDNITQYSIANEAVSVSHESDPQSHLEAPELSEIPPVREQESTVKWLPVFVGAVVLFIFILFNPWQM